MKALEGVKVRLLVWRHELLGRALDRYVKNIRDLGLERELVSLKRKARSLNLKMGIHKRNDALRGVRLLQFISLR